MAPEYGATVGYFPVDGETLRYLGARRPARPAARRPVGEYCVAQGLLREPTAPSPSTPGWWSSTWATSCPASPVRGDRRTGWRCPTWARGLPVRFRPWRWPVAGPTPPSAPPTSASWASRAEVLGRLEGEGGQPLPEHLVPPPRTEDVWVDPEGREWTTLRDGAVVIAAITSCTNTSNPSVMIGAGLLARNAVRRGTAGGALGEDQPGSRFARGDRLPGAGRAAALPGGPALSGGGIRLHHLHRQQRPAPRAHPGGHPRGPAGDGGRAQRQPQLRGPHPSAGAGELPGLAHAGGGVRPGGHRGRGPRHRSAGHRRIGRAVYLRDLWPADEEIAAAVAAGVGPDPSPTEYASVFDGDESWRRLAVPHGHLYAWDPASTYVQEPPFFAEFGPSRLRWAIVAGRACPGHLRRLGDHRPHLPGRRDRGRRTGRAATWSSTAWRRPTSTPTGRGGATTR